MEDSNQEVSLYRAFHHAANHGGIHKALKLKEGEPLTKEHIKAAQGHSHPNVRLMGHVMDAKQAHDMAPDPQGATKAMAKDVGF